MSHEYPKALFVVALMAIACGTDPRQAVLVPEAELTETTKTAVGAWKEATNDDVRWKVRESCGEADLCVRIGLVDQLEGDLVGLTTRDDYVGTGGVAEAHVMILRSWFEANSDEPDGPTEAVRNYRRARDKELNDRNLTHELGHVLGIQHVPSESEIMHSEEIDDGLPHCFGGETLGQYHDLFGVQGKEFCLASP